MDKLIETYRRRILKAALLRHQRKTGSNCLVIKLNKGGVTHEYFMAHQRCIRRLLRILARKREMEKWCEKWDAMHDRFVKEVDALQAIKPAGVK